LLTALLCVPLALADDKPPAGFEPLFNGKDLTGWKVHGGKMESWGAGDGLMFTTGENGGWLLTEKEYADFEARFEYKMPPGGNSGFALRAPRMGDPAYQGMEIQLLDDDAPQYKNLRPAQYTGSVYDVVAAKRGFTKPAGEWNKMRIVCKGRKVLVELNGTVITEADLDEQKEHYKRHPGLTREKGHVGFQAHGGRVEFRNVFIKVY
jgi:hypothetical protein